MTFLPIKTVTTKTKPLKNSQQIKIKNKDVAKFNNKIQADIKKKRKKNSKWNKDEKMSL